MRSTRYAVISSLGRTGTQFLGRYLSEMIAGAESLHEPDVVWTTRPWEWFPKVAEFGIRHMTYGKLSPRYSVRAMGVARRSGKISAQTAATFIQALREPLISKCSSGVLVEANAAFRGVLDLVPIAFPNACVVFIVRDPRDWVRSLMNMGNKLYGKGDLMTWIPNARLKPRDIGDTSNAHRWRAMDRFEQLCWAWNAETEFVTAQLSSAEVGMVIRFEDLFGKHPDPLAWPNLLDYIAGEGGRRAYELDRDLLRNKVHSRKYGVVGHWREWSDDRIAELNSHCGTLMRKYGYGNEQDWKNRLGDLTGNTK